MQIELTLPRIQALYTRYKKQDPYAGWLGSYTAELVWTRDLTDATFVLPASQERLWRSKGISTLGPGEAVGVSGAYTDPEVAGALLALRKARLPEEPGARSRWLQEQYDRMLALVWPKHAAMRPQAKLARLFTALFPRDTLTAYSTVSAKNVNHLVLGNRVVRPIEGMVLVRQRLRAALGPEADLAEDVRRATFCWWLHENYDVISQGQDPVGEVPKPPVVDPVVAPKAPPLVLDPVAKQRKGLTAIGGYLETWRAVVSAARNGASPDDIVTTLRTVYGLEALSPKTCRALFNDVRNNGFLEFKDGLWHPSEDGTVLVDVDPPDVLVERFLIHTYGLPQVLRTLRAGPRTRKDVFAELRRRYPWWIGDFAPSAQLSWGRALGLVGVEADGRQSLTEYGQAWEARLPDELPDPEPPPTQEPPSGTPLPGKLVPVPFAAVLEKMSQDLPDFVLDDAQLRCLHVAWHCNPAKRFVLLSGLSGTGKTALLHHYARAYAVLSKLEPDEQLAVVPVSPDWRDPTGLLGYHNPLHTEATWHREPALRLLLDAAQHPERPYFLVLDEMNLAHVEQYFAPFLSAMETGLELRLHEEEDEINGVPPAIRWPQNLFVGGTLNMDETTHTISDKVLDRAFTLEFWDVNLADYLAKRAVAPALASLLLDLHAILAGVRRHFGYRTAGEILAFLGHAEATAALTDQAIFSKVLPRLRGEDSPAFVAALQAAQKRCADAGLTRCAAKLGEMRERLSQSGVARFWA